MLAATDFRSLGGHFPPLFLGHGLEPTLPADLTALRPIAAMYADRSMGATVFVGTMNSSGLFSVERSTIHLASWFDREGGFLFRLYRGMWSTKETRNAIAKPIRNPAHIHLCFTDLMMPQAEC